MSRYIDADALLTDELTHTLPVGCGSASGRVVVFVDDIEKQPTADVVEVVRCRDCKFRNTPACAMWYMCDNCGVQYSWENNNGYCGYGERRAEDAKR